MRAAVLAGSFALFGGLPLSQTINGLSDFSSLATSYQAQFRYKLIQHRAAGLVFNVTKGKLTPFTFGTWLLSLNPARSQPSLSHPVCVLGVQVLV